MNDTLFYLNKKIKSKDKVVIATSGGPDSMFLLNLMCELRKKINFEIIVAHVNHKLRIESEEEAKFVEEFCKINNLIYEYMEIKEYNEDNLESEARKKRYEFFNKLVIKYKANYLMTAHHGDDLIETILMRLVRGSSLKGYSGFSKEVHMQDYELIRPLITLTKDEILDYMNKHNLTYFIDKSNFSKEYTRNRYRLEVLPFLKKENKNVHLKFLKFSEELENTNRILKNYIKELLLDIDTEKGLYIPKLLELDDFLIKKIIEYQFEHIYINDLFLIRDKNTERIIELLKSKKSNGVVSLPNNYQGIKEYNYFKIVHTKERTNFCIELEEITNIPTGKIKRIKETFDRSNYTLRLNSKNIELPLIVRNRLKGDKIEIKNLKGTKKVKDILINEKIPLRKRDTFPIVADSKNQILWLPGVKKSKFDVETNGIYDIILSYEEEKNEY